MERHDKYIGSVEKIFFPKTTKKKNKKKTKKIFDVTMLLILVNYSSSNPKSLIN